MSKIKQNGFGNYGIKFFSIADKETMIEWYESKQVRDDAFTVLRSNQYYSDVEKVGK